MPVTTLGPKPTIKLMFQGLTLGYIQDEQPFAEMVSVLGSPCHRPRLIIIKNGENVPLPAEVVLDEGEFITDDVILEVQNTSLSKISIFNQPGFNRGGDEGNTNDFQWYVDIVDDVLQGIPFTLDCNQLGPMFQTNSGVFYTEAKTKDATTIQRQASANAVPFGKAAQIIAANIYLDQLYSKAVLRVGDTPVLTVNACDVVNDVSYEIRFDCECNQVGIQESDFRLVYNAIKPQLPAGEKPPTIEGGDADTSSANPQVYCLGGGVKTALKPPR